MILVAAEHGMSAPDIAAIVQAHEPTVRTWCKRYEAEGVEGLQDARRPGSPKHVTPEYRTQGAAVVRRRPRRLGLPDARWTLARVADEMAEYTGIRVAAETGRTSLPAAEMVLSRP
jgi:transposase